MKYREVFVYKGAIMKYRKKPVVIDAIQWTGDNVEEIDDFINEDGIFVRRSDRLFIETLVGTHTASKGDFIIKGIKGEFCPCKPDIFEKTYEPV